MTRRDTVSAVIPTRHRPDLVLRAVRSALAQQHKDMEVIVVIDGPDARTAAVLNEIEDRRLQVIALPEATGAANARNAGVANAAGDWIAFLDDDDEWLPEKTLLQMQLAKSSRFHYPIVSCQVFARTNSYEIVWPRRRPSEPLCNYLLARNSWSYGDGLLSTTTLLFPKDLFSQQPFRSSLRRHQDLDWVLRAAKFEGAGIEFISEPLAVWHLGEGRARISTTADWRLSLEWVESVREMITGRAYASFVATHIAPQAARQGDWKAFIILLKKMVMLGKPNSRDVLLFLAMWSMPHGLRQAVRKAGR
jgi:glycosyltransferase involved in cell wall biosynthesis